TQTTFIVSTIEKRLQDLQRKLSEIAEIPKILSSTLATVSQTFDKLTTTLPPPIAPTHCRHHFPSGNEYCPHFYGNEQRRKLSYDEDVYDFELSDEADGVDAVDEDFDAKQAYLQLKRYAAKHRKSKDVTPESDYASESNYQPNDTDCKDQTDLASANDGDDNDVTDDDYNYDDNDNAAVTTSNDEDDDSEKSCDMYEEFNLSVLKIPLGHVNDEYDIKEYADDDDDEKDSADDEDFLTTTFTWNLRNKPKLQITDSDENDNVNKRDNDDEGDDKLYVSQPKSLNESKDILCQKQHSKADTPEKEQKLDKLERSWPWADREKIIYKQSTCHLVPHKPLGLIEKRIQLLVKRNLLEHINKTKNPQ
ncbi:RNA polymerase-associated protein LEO1-like, partial [Calliphora vicina]|uniref:RNA polymerase-associated protein LEO1-like n=1 Tax=Calliphora vicina TaxID=7373 RepID=UPI00325B1584